MTEHKGADPETQPIAALVDYWQSLGERRVGDMTFRELATELAKRIGSQCIHWEHEKRVAIGYEEQAFERCLRDLKGSSELSDQEVTIVYTNVEPRTGPLEFHVAKHRPRTRWVRCKSCGEPVGFYADSKIVHYNVGGCALFPVTAASAYEHMHLDAPEIQEPQFDMKGLCDV